MRIRKRPILVVAASLLLISATFAQEHRFAVFAHTGRAFPEENKTRGGFEPGGGISFFLSRHFAVSLEYSTWENRSLRSTAQPYYGTITISPILLSLQYEFPPNEFCVPYIFAGGGLAFAQPKSLASVTSPGTKIDEAVKSGLGLYLGLGARISLSNSVCFLSEASYFRRSAPAQATSSDIEQGTTTDNIHVSLRTVLLRVGIKYLF
jgi:opacity protein-like surface antigen